jgi:hypothetical protein
MTSAAPRSRAAITGPAQWSTSPPPPPPPRLGDAVVVPFPFAKRRAYIRRQLDNVAGYRPEAARRYLDARIADRVRLLRRAGVAEHLIAADIAPVAQMFRDRLHLMFGARSLVS